MVPKLYLTPENGVEIDISKAIKGLKFLGDSSAPALVNNFEQNAGVDGQRLTTQTFDKTTINANFWLHWSDYYDYMLAKHEVYSLLSNRRMMRLRTDSEPAIVKYVYATPFDIQPSEPGANDSLFTIPFDNPSGYKFSAVNSDQLTADYAQFGMNLPADTDLTYHFTSPQFMVYNASDITVDPYYQRHKLRIITRFTGDKCVITNNTNGTEWSYNAASDSTETIVLDGINTTLDGQPASAKTDYGNISLEPGWNSITVTGTTAVDITFSFPFIYLG